MRRAVLVEERPRRIRRRMAAPDQHLGGRPPDAQLRRASRPHPPEGTARRARGTGARPSGHAMAALGRALSWPRSSGAATCTSPPGARAAGPARPREHELRRACLLGAAPAGRAAGGSTSSTGAGTARAPTGPDGSTSTRTPATSAALLDGPADLVGHSYGGVVCLLAAALRPEGVRSLTVIEPPAFAVARGDAGGRGGHRPDRPPLREGQVLSEEAFLDGFLRAWGFEQLPPRTLSPRARRGVRSSMTERMPWEAAIPLDRLAAAGLPVLVARGAWDEVEPSARELAGAAFAAVCAVLVERLDAEEAVFPGAAHQPQLLGAAVQRPPRGVLALGVRAGLSARSTPPARTPGRLRTRSPPTRAHGCRRGASRRRPRSRSTTSRRSSLP